MLITSPDRDPLGQAALAYLAGKRQAKVHVYSHVAVDDVLPAAYLFRDFEAMPAWEKTALQACRGSVLDIGAGVGSHALWLQEQGLAVTAMDISPGAVAVMQSRGVKRAVQASIWDYTGPAVDTLLLLMNGIGLVGTLKGLNTFLQKAHTWLQPGGQIILDSSDLIYLFEQTERAPYDDWRGDKYHGVITYQMVYETAQSDPFEWLYLSYPKLSKHARQFGYQCELLTEGPHFEYVARLTPAPQKRGAGPPDPLP